VVGLSFADPNTPSVPNQITFDGFDSSRNSDPDGNIYYFDRQTSNNDWAIGGVNFNLGNNTYGTNMRLVLSSRHPDINVAPAQFNAMSAALIEKHPIVTCFGGICHF
jgi:hypothetical protein